ncbi:MAG: hypothetical protein F6K55_23240 [Moorea sp. SIO4A3]|nr:hypothetical protein [Moorena sp. SIO4A3]
MRYGADYPKTGYGAKNNGKSAPNTPYELLPLAFCLSKSTPDSLNN